MRFPRLREYLEELNENSRLAKRDKQRALAELEYLDGLKDSHDNMWEICANFEMRWGAYGTEWRVVGETQTFGFEKEIRETKWYGDGCDKEASALVSFLNAIPSLWCELCAMKERFLTDGFGNVETLCGYGVIGTFVPRFSSRDGIEGVVRAMEKLGYKRCGTTPILFVKARASDRFCG